MISPLAEINVGRAERRAVIQVENLTVDYGGMRAVDGVSISFQGGVVTGIIGPNGAGKSSVMNVIAGVTVPTRGRIRLDGKDMTGKPPYRMARAGVVRTFQEARVFGRLSVLDNLLVGIPRQAGDTVWGAFAGRRYWRGGEVRAEERAVALLRDFGLDHHVATCCNELSGGQRRIVEYLRALLAKPSVLLLDEPSVGLAPWLVDRLGEDLKRLAAGGCCVLLIEHDLGLIRIASDRVVGMVGGRLVVDGSFESALKSSVLQSAYLGRT